MAQRELPRAVKMAAEIAKIKRSLNVEKKHKDVTLSPVAIGQVNFNSDGASVVDLTPTIAQGTDGDERNGNSCKLTGFAMKYQMIGQHHCQTKRRIRFMLVKSSGAVGAGAAGGDVLSALFDVNPLTGVRDLHAPRNYSSMKHHGLAVLRTSTCYIAGQTTSTKDSGTHDNAHKTGTFTASLQDVLRFDGSADNTPEHVKYYLIVQSDVGNVSTSDSTLSVPVTTNSSGVDMKSTLRTWWVDN